MTQEQASPKPVKVDGELVLVCDVGHWSESNMYGWIELDFDRLKAAVGPDARSRSPELPGVRVSVDQFPSSVRLWIDSGANRKPRTYLRDGREVKEAIMDGHGIVMSIKAMSGSGVNGRWTNAGIAYMGSGALDARRSGTE